MATIEQKEKLIKQIRGVQRIVINKRHGGFGLSSNGVLRYLELSGQPCWSEFDKKYESLGIVTYWLVPPGPDRIKGDPDNWHEMTMTERQAHNQKYSEQVFHDKDIPRDDPFLVKVVEEMGDSANGKYADLKVVEIPGDVDWEIKEYDGAEWVAEKHRTWE